MLSALPGWLIAQFFALSLEQIALLTSCSKLICFPILLMSQLDINSPWGILSGRILASLARCPFSWLLFYLESAVLAAICGVVVFVTMRIDLTYTLLAMPLYIAALIIYARLVGRLGWRLAEAMPANE